MEKKKWKSPLLTILMKGKPEEKVLDNCKGGSQPQHLSTYHEGSYCLYRPFVKCEECKSTESS